MSHLAGQCSFEASCSTRPLGAARCRFSRKAALSPYAGPRRATAPAGPAKTVLRAALGQWPGCEPPGHLAAT
jgi:hypothetical protein